MCIPIPYTNTASEGEVATPSLVWPARPGVPGDCYCPPYENDVELTKFSACYVTCDTTYSIHNINGSICFSNLTSTMNNTPVHFVTLTSPCRYPECFIRTVITSYDIVISDHQQDSSTADVTLESSDITRSGDSHATSGIKLSLTELERLSYSYIKNTTTMLTCMTDLHVIFPCTAIVITYLSIFLYSHFPNSSLWCIKLFTMDS